MTLRVRPDGAERPRSNAASVPYQLAATITWGEERIVRVDHYVTDFVPTGHILFAATSTAPA